MTIDTDAIESLRDFALDCPTPPAWYGTELDGKLLAFAHLCTAALAGEEWAAERVQVLLSDLGTQWTRIDTEAKIEIIAATDTTRPDGAIARSVEV